MLSCSKSLGCGRAARCLNSPLATRIRAGVRCPVPRNRLRHQVSLFGTYLLAENSSRPKRARIIVLGKILLVLFVSLVPAVVPISVFARQFEDTSAPEPAHELSHSESAGASTEIKAFTSVRI
jgi:hypothetical protein